MLIQMVKHIPSRTLRVIIWRISEFLNILENNQNWDPKIIGAGIGFKPTGDDIHPEVSAAVELNLKNPPQKEEDRIY